MNTFADKKRVQDRYYTEIIFEKKAIENDRKIDKGRETRLSNERAAIWSLCMHVEG